MSMHEIESLVESSVITVATALPVPPLAQSICYSLYQLQDQLDCGYTVLRVREELQQLGYLFLLPPERLPEPERGAVMKFSEEGGFLDDDTYFDRESGLCCITAGSELWKKLIGLGVLPASTRAELRLLDPLELAELIVPLASKALAEGDKRGADTLGLWYAFFPLLCVVAGFDDDHTPEPERIRALLELLAVPEAFEVAEAYGRGLDFDFEEEEMSFLAGWGTPYNQWKGKQESLFPDFCKRMVYDYLSKNNFVEADRYASSLEDGPEYAKLFHRSLVTVTCHNWLKTQDPEVTPPEGILSLAEAKAGLEYLSGLALPAKQKMLCRMSLVQAQLLTGEVAVAADTLKMTYIEVLEVLNQKPDGNEKRIQHAALAISYYQMLNDNIPGEYSGKKELMSQGIPGMMDLPAAREIFCEFLPLVPQMAEDMQASIDLCDQIIQQMQKFE
jgi:hypothetical protein